jgi:hypothetical protein
MNTSSRITPCTVNGTRYNSFKEAGLALGITGNKVRIRCLTKTTTYQDWIALYNEKAPAFTDDELREIKRLTSAAYNKAVREAKAAKIESWKEIPLPGMNGALASSFGRIQTWSFRQNKLILRNVENSINSAGYQLVDIHGVAHLVHRLVGLAHIPNPNNLETINHKWEDKLDNRAASLEWMSRGDNVRYSMSVPVGRYSKDGTQLLQSYVSMAAAGNDGYCRKAISEVCRGKRKSHDNFVWKKLN